MEEFKDAEEELPPFDENLNEPVSVTEKALSSKTSLVLQPSPVSPDTLNEVNSTLDSTTTTEENPNVTGTSTENSAVQSSSTPHSSLEIHSIPPLHQFEENRSVGHVEVVTNDAETKIEDGPVEISNHRVEVGSSQEERSMRQTDVKRGLVDTRAPFESVKEAVTRFGGIVDWQAHKALALERRKHVQLELEKVREEIPDYRLQAEAAEEAKTRAQLELDSTNRHLEELKLNVEKAQTEEAQAKQDSELAQLRAKEMEQGITDEASIAAKTQLEVARERHGAAISELKSLRKELEELQKGYVSLLEERDIAMKKAEEAVVASKEMEKTVEELTLELIVTKEALESEHAVHLEAEEHRICAALERDQDYLNWETELKKAEEELCKLDEELLSTKELEGKLGIVSTLLRTLESEFAAFIESKLNQEDSGSTNYEEKGGVKTQTELEVVKTSIEKAKDEVNLLRVAESSLKSELERDKAGLVTLRQREGMASIALSSLEAEIEKTKEEIDLVSTMEKEAQEKMAELPNLLQKAGYDAELAKAAAESARDELREANEDAEQAKASLNTFKVRLTACLKEIEAAKASEKLVLSAIRALRENGREGVTIALEEYYTLSKRAHEAEEQSNELVNAAMVDIEVAKESELRTLERLEESHREMKEKKEALGIAREKAEKANEGKLGIEQELRVWRAEHEQRRRSSNFTGNGNIPSKSRTSSTFRKDAEDAKTYSTESEADENAVAELKGRRRRRKKSLIPRIVMFLARKKAETL